MREEVNKSEGPGAGGQGLENGVVRERFAFVAPENGKARAAGAGLRWLVFLPDSMVAGSAN